MGRIGDGVVVTGTTDDGVVEAFEVAGRPEVFAVQWHPEMLSDQVDPAFLWLVPEAGRPPELEFCVTGRPGGRTVRE